MSETNACCNCGQETEYEAIYVCEECQTEEAKESDQLRASLSSAQARVKELEGVLTEIRNSKKLWRSGGIGGQDSYAGLPPMLRIIDAALSRVAKPTDGGETR